MLRSVCHLQVDEGMRRSCFTCYRSCSAVFLAPNRTFTGTFNYLPLYLGPDRPDSMPYYPISCCGSIATLPEPQFLLLATVTCVQSDHVPKSPAEMPKSQLWTLITVFWLGFVTPYFTTNLVYIYIDHLSKVCSDIAQPKKSHFFMIRA